MTTTSVGEELELPFIQSRSEAELRLARANPGGSYLSKEAQAMNESEGAARYAQFNGGRVRGGK